MQDSDDSFILLLTPDALTKGNWEDIRKIARVVMEQELCDYTKAVVIAYLEFIEMSGMDKTKH